MATPIAPEVRFWKKVDQREDCWVWTGAILSNGYGYFGVSSNANMLAHRWAYEAMVSSIPAGLVIDHLCRNRACVNPYHMEPVTQAVNVRRGRGPQLLSAMRSGLTHCQNGHEFTPENTYVRPDGHRNCRTCSRLRGRDRKRRLRAARGDA